MFTLCTNVNFVRTTSTLQGQPQLCTNNVHTLYEQRQLCKDNDNFVRIMFTLCTDNVNFARTTTTLSEQRPHLSEQRRIHYEETRNYRLTLPTFGNWRLFQYGWLYRSLNCQWYKYVVDHQDNEYFLFTWHFKDMCTG